VTALDQVVLDAEAIGLIVRRVAAEIAERTRSATQLGLVGIRGGGEPIAMRVAAEIERIGQRKVPTGALDIALYRDDSASALGSLEVEPNRMDFEVEGADVVLVDDVLHTGRTVRAAIDCLFDYGRPRRVWLAVLCDRGGRQLPIAADFVGTQLVVPDGFALDVAADGGGDDRAILRAWRPSEAPGGQPFVSTPGRKA
jgi:pyrimidine operon attenuation protein / uracil phosphoribosyltransferase